MAWMPCAAPIGQPVRAQTRPRLLLHVNACAQCTRAAPLRRGRPWEEGPACARESSNRARHAPHIFSPTANQVAARRLPLLGHRKQTVAMPVATVGSSRLPPGPSHTRPHQQTGIPSLVSSCIISDQMPMVCIRDARSRNFLQQWRPLCCTMRGAVPLALLSLAAAAVSAEARVPMAAALTDGCTLSLSPLHRRAHRSPFFLPLSPATALRSSRTPAAARRRIPFATAAPRAVV